MYIEMSDQREPGGDEVRMDANALAERLKRPEVAAALARLIVDRVRERLTQAPLPVPARKP